MVKVKKTCSEEMQQQHKWFINSWGTENRLEQPPRWSSPEQLRDVFMSSFIPCSSLLGRHADGRQMFHPGWRDGTHLTIGSILTRRVRTTWDKSIKPDHIMTASMAARQISYSSKNQGGEVRFVCPRSGRVSPESDQSSLWCRNPLHQRPDWYRREGDKMV